MIVLCINGTQQKKRGEKSILPHLKHIRKFPILQESNEEEHHPGSTTKRKASQIMFSAETGLSETLFWDQARLSSPVNKQVSPI